METIQKSYLKGETNMEDRNQKLLDEVIGKEIQNLSDLPIGSQEKSKAVDNLTELYKLKIEEAKIKQAKAEKSEEMEIRQKQLKSQALDRWINVGVQVGLAIGSLIAYDVWFKRGLRFEETGTITSPMTRNLLSRMLPRK